MSRTFLGPWLVHGCRPTCNLYQLKKWLKWALYAGGLAPRCRSWVPESHQGRKIETHQERFGSVTCVGTEHTCAELPRTSAISAFLGRCSTGEDAGAAGSDGFPARAILLTRSRSASQLALMRRGRRRPLIRECASPSADLRARVSRRYRGPVWPMVADNPPPPNSLTRQPYCGGAF